MKADFLSMQKKYGIDAALDLSEREVVRLHRKYLNSISTQIVKFLGTSRKFIKAEGIYLTDDKNQTYLDFLSGYGALNLGHEPHEVLEALCKIENRPNILQAGLNPFAAKLAELLAEVTPGQLCRSFFCNSGTEAVEAGLKLARCATGKRIIISTKSAFHGKTFGALSVSGKDKYKTPFSPLVPDVKIIEYNDLRALERELRRRKVAAFIVEPIQGEAGVIVPHVGYLKKVQELCRKYNALLIVDEIQTGLGRTGKLFCCQHEEVEPDIMLLSKSLSGGVIPIGALVTTDNIWKKAYGKLDTCLLHTSTFGGNSRACACGIAALTTIITEGYINNAEVEGEFLLHSLKLLQEKFPNIILEVRGRGLMIGLHFASVRGNSPLLEGGLTLWLVRYLLNKHHIITAFTLNNYDVLRLAPPLGVTRKQSELFLIALEDALEKAYNFDKFRLLRKE